MTPSPSAGERTYGGKTLAELKALHDANGPSWPWRFEEDWTCEVYGADGDIVGKLARQGLLAVSARNALPDLIERIEELERAAPPATASEQDVERVEAALDPYLHGMITPKAKRQAALAAIAALPASGERARVLEEAARLADTWCARHHWPSQKPGMERIATEIRALASPAAAGDEK